MPISPLGEAVKLRREQLGMSQNDLARVAGVSHQAIRGLEQGRTKDTKHPTERALIRALRWPVDAFFRIREGDDWRKIETIEWANTDSVVVDLQERLAALELRVKRVEHTIGPDDLGVLSKDEQDIMDLSWPMERKRELILKMRSNADVHTDETQEPHRRTQ